MARPRSPNQDKALKLWLDSGKKRPLKDIAKELNISEEQVRKWKSVGKWDKVTLPNAKGNVTNKRGGQPGNKNAVGGPGGAPPIGNKNAEKHGLFSKHLPAEMLEIMDEIDSQRPEDIVWGNIVIQYAAIIRSQQIMFVGSKDDLTKELKRVKTSTSGGKGKDGKEGKNKASELEYELQFAWDKQAGYLQAQSRAMQALNSLIKQFLEMSDPYDERRLKLESMRVDIDYKRNAVGSAGANKDLVKAWVQSVQESRRNTDAEK